VPTEPITVGMSLITQGADQFTGTSSYIQELLREFSRHPSGIRVHALCNEHAFAVFGDYESDRVSLTLAAGGSVGASRAARAHALLKSVARPSRLARQFAPDTAIVHYPLTLGVPRTRLPTVLTLHDLQHHDLPANFSFAEHRWRRALYDRHARTATLVVTVSEYSRRRIIETLGIGPERVVAIPHGVDAQRFSPHRMAADEAAVAALDLPDRFLLYPATIWPHKNHRRLLEAFARVPDDRVHLLLCGATAGRLEELLAAAAERGLAHRVRHLGFVPADALPALYRRAAALVFPSVYEGFGLPPLEAMASGCPVASSTRGPLAEVCGDATAVLDPDDPEQMARTISTVLDDEGLRRRLRSAGLAQAARFSWRTAADAHVAVYERARELRAVPARATA
jgi:glycosyltransferase involved in cell wall biosynthesis